MTVLVAGGGTVATRKIGVLLNAGAAILVVAPQVTHQISQLEESGVIKVLRDRYHASHLTNIFLVVAATNDAQINQKIAIDAQQRGLLVTVTDAPQSGNCTFPAVLRRGDLEISISSNGKYPGYAAEIRTLLAHLIGDEYGLLLETLSIEREKLLTAGLNNTYNKQVLRSRARELINELNIHKERVP